MNIWIAVAIGGAIGALNRYALVTLVHFYAGKDFPYGTLIVNVLGSFLIGWVLVLATERAHWHPAVSGLVVTGFLGAFTTFSAFSMETLSLIQKGAFELALANIALNVLLCLAAVYFGTCVAKTFS